MNCGKYDTISCKRNELSCIDQGNQLLIIKNTMNIITNYFLQCNVKSY